MQLKIKRGFLWAFRGCDVVSFEAGQTVDTEDKDLIDVSVHEGWAETEEKKLDAPANKAKKPPENKRN